MLKLRFENTRIKSLLGGDLLKGIRTTTWGILIVKFEHFLLYVILHSLI